MIVTDNHDWTTQEIVERCLDWSKIEKQFRASKSSNVGVTPFFHWTDGKIRCHLLSCVIALTVLRLIEQTVKAARADELLSGQTILEEMRRLHSVWSWYPGKQTPERMLETPACMTPGVRVEYEVSAIFESSILTARKCGNRFHRAECPWIRLVSRELGGK